MNLIDRPNNPVVLNAVHFGERPQPTIIREQHAVLETLGKGECECVVNRELRGLASVCSRAMDALRRQLYYFEPSLDEQVLLGWRVPDEFPPSRSASAIRTSYGKSRRAPSKAAFLSSIRQRLSLTIGCIGVLRILQTCP